MPLTMGGVQLGDISYVGLSYMSPSCQLGPPSLLTTYCLTPPPSKPPKHSCIPYLRSNITLHYTAYSSHPCHQRHVAHSDNEKCQVEIDISERVNQESEWQWKLLDSCHVIKWLKQVTSHREFYLWIFSTSTFPKSRSLECWNLEVDNSRLIWISLQVHYQSLIKIQWKYSVSRNSRSPEVNDGHPSQCLIKSEPLDQAMKG